MTKRALIMTALLGGLLCCTREDGLPDPPFQALVPCNTDGGADDPLACPQAPEDAAAPQVDAGTAAD